MVDAMDKLKKNSFLGSNKRDRLQKACDKSNNGGAGEPSALMKQLIQEEENLLDKHSSSGSDDNSSDTEEHFGFHMYKEEVDIIITSFINRLEKCKKETLLQ